LEELLRYAEVFHHGDCLGADMQAHGIAMKKRLRVVIWPPLDGSQRAYCVGGEVRPADDYLKRNHKIVSASDALIACPRTISEELRSGTWATIRYAGKVARPTFIIFPHGRIEERNT